jgi:hypothetical protein
MAEQIKFGDRLFLSGERVIAEVDVQINRDLKVNRDVVIQGNLDVNGTVTTIDTTDLFIADPIVGMNYDHTGPASEDVGFEIHRGDDTNVFFVWDETLDSWSTRGTDLQVRNLWATGNTLINGFLHVDGQSTLASANIEDLTDNRIVIVGIDGELEDDANFTMDGITFDIGQGKFTVDVATGDTYIAGQLTAESANVKDLTDNRIVIVGIDGELEDDANFTFDATTFDIGQGNFTVDVATGDTYIAGQLTAESANVKDLTDNRIVIVGIDGELEDDPNFTMDGITFDIGQGKFTVDVATGDTYMAGDFYVSGQTTLASLNVEDLTNDRIVIAGVDGELEDDANFTFDATTFNIGQDNFTVDVATGITAIKGYTSFLSTDAIKIPSGTTAQRPGEPGVTIAVEQGMIRYNTQDITFEGYDGTNWGSLGGVKDVDQNTYIIPETSPGTDNNQLDFYTEAGHRMRIDSNGDILIGNNLDKFTINNLTGDTYIAGQLTAESANIKDLTDNRIVIAGVNGELEDDANFTFNATEFNIGQDNFTVDVATGYTDVSGTTALKVPNGTTAQRPGETGVPISEDIGQIRYNTDEQLFEGWDGVVWGSIGSSVITLSDSSPTFPAPREGDLWYDTLTTGRAYVYSETLTAWIDLSPGSPGSNGLSAYEVALEEGFVGTETEWLASLQGEQGVGTIVSTSAPSTPDLGDAWYDTSTPDQGLYVWDGTSWLNSMGPNIDTTSTGVDITGTLTSDGLTVDGTDTEAAGSQLLKVRNSTTGEAVTIGLYAKADNAGDGNSGSITFDAGADGTATNNQLRFSADHQTDTNPALRINGNKDISFYEDTGTTAKFFWDASAESLGIGTSSPSALLHLESAGPSIKLVDSDNNPDYEIKNGNGSFRIIDTTAGSDRINISSAGNVGIGTTSPDANSGLTVESSTTSGQIMIKGNSGGNAGIALRASGQTTNFSIYENSGANLVFQKHASERMRLDASGNLLVGTTSGSDKVTVNGTVSATNFNTTSDATLKTNVETLSGSLDAVTSLRGVSFDWLENGGSEIGVIAQEVEAVLPDVVSTNDEGIKSVKYGNMVAVLIEAIKEQQAQIDELKKQHNS